MPISSLSSRCITPRTRVPSLHRNYPPSQVLWTPPTPARAQPQRLVAFSEPWQVSRVSPICFHACCAHYPGERIGLLWSVAPTDPGGLRPFRGGSALASSPFEACSGFTRVAARMVAICQNRSFLRGFDGLVALATARIATEMHRQFLRADLHRLQMSAFHGTP